MPPSLRQALLAPRAVALIGASGDPKKNTSRPQRYLRKHGYGGRIYPINPGRDEVMGEPAYPDLQSVPGLIDHAFVMVPGPAVPEAIAQCVACGVPVATVFSDGFSETGATGAAAEAALVDRARAGGLRLLGPNSIGVIATRPTVALSVNAVLDLPALIPGRLGVVSQSGSMLGTLLSRGHARGIGFSKLVSVGNEADLGVAELIELLIEDGETEAILLFLEGIRQGDRLAKAVHDARRAGKPVIALKLGRSVVGQALAASHTGAMAGTDELTDAFFRRHGVVRVDMLETLLEIPPLVIGQRPPAGKRVAVMTTTGGGAALVADRLGTLGVDITPPPEPVIAGLAERGIKIGRAPLTDLTLAGTKKEIYGAVLTALLASDHCDAVVAVVGSSGQFHPHLAVEPIVEATPRTRPLAVFIAPDAPQSLDLLREAGIAAFRTPESCADAVRAILQWATPHEERIPEPPAAVLELLARRQGERLDEQAASMIFEALGIPQARRQVLETAETTCTLPFPVAAKVLSPDIMHKTEAGGVELNLATPEALETAATRIFERCRVHAPEARINGVLVQTMERGRSEVMIGFRRDPQVGPVVLIAAGGTLTEIYRDFAVRLAPVGLDEAMAMIQEVRGLAPIRGYRNMPRGDVTALAHALHRLSLLASCTAPKVVEAEINPLIVKAPGEGVVGVDALLVCEP